jgi:hypothetical protein
VGVHRCQGGQYPPQIGAALAPQAGGSVAHVHPPAAPPGRHTLPAAQNPLHAGADALEQVGVGVTHVHADPAALAAHSVPLGQTPAQTGAAADPQGTTSGSHRHADPAEFGRHAWPAGQSPPHTGAAELPHASGSCAQLQVPPAGFPRHTDPLGQDPPHSGYGLLPHGAERHVQTAPVAVHSCPSGHGASQAGAAAFPQGTSNGAHAHAPAALIRQIWNVGHGPAQAGADAAPHVGTTGTHEQEVAPEAQAYPCGQEPSHAGTEASWHGVSGSAIVSHWHPPARPGKHSALGGQVPSHAGAVDPHGVGVMHTQTLPPEFNRQTCPAGHSPSQAATAESPQARGPGMHTQAPMSSVTHS